MFALIDFTQVLGSYQIYTNNTQELHKYHQLEWGLNTRILIDYACLNMIQLTVPRNPVLQSLTAHMPAWTFSNSSHTLSGSKLSARCAYTPPRAHCCVLCEPNQSDRWKCATVDANDGSVVDKRTLPVPGIMRQPQNNPAHHHHRRHCRHRHSTPDRKTHVANTSPIIINDICLVWVCVYVCRRCVCGCVYIDASSPSSSSSLPGNHQHHHHHDPSIPRPQLESLDDKTQSTYAWINLKAHYRGRSEWRWHLVWGTSSFAVSGTHSIAHQRRQTETLTHTHTVCWAPICWLIQLLLYAFVNSTGSTVALVHWAPADAAATRQARRAHQRPPPRKSPAKLVPLYYQPHSLRRHGSARVCGTCYIESVCVWQPCNRLCADMSGWCPPHTRRQTSVATRFLCRRGVEAVAVTPWAVHRVR